MKFTININYDTGDSFSQTTGVNDIVELEWENLEIAKENLIYIKEHYELYQSQNAYNRKYSEKVLKESKSKPWFANSNSGFYTSLKLKTDDGKFMQLYTFWCGYFENLNYIEIIPVKGEELNDLKIYI